jgi:hypothetical protein
VNSGLNFLLVFGLSVAVLPVLYLVGVTAPSVVFRVLMIVMVFGAVALILFGAFLVNGRLQNLANDLVRLINYERYEKDTLARIAELESRKPRDRQIGSVRARSHITPDVLPSEFPILSGMEGEFAPERNGPWTKSVLCNPVHHRWNFIQGAKWVWIRERPTDEEAQRGQTVWHRLIFTVATTQVRTARLTFYVDDFATLYINEKLAKERSRNKVEVDITEYLQSGRNEMLVQIENSPIRESTGVSNPSGIIYRLDVG